MICVRCNGLLKSFLVVVRELRVIVRSRNQKFLERHIFAIVVDSIDNEFISSHYAILFCPLDYKSIVPMINLTWGLARNIRIPESKLAEHVK